MVVTDSGVGAVIVLAATGLPPPVPGLVAAREGG